MTDSADTESSETQSFPPPTKDGDNEFAELVSGKRLRGTWGRLRSVLRKQRFRDAIDWLDWSVNIDSNIDQIKRDLISGDYVPSRPSTYEYPKSKGSYRTLSVLNVRDALVYRLLVDEALVRANPYKVKGAFFARSHELTPVGPTFDIAEESEDDYEKFWDIWLRYQQYRTVTMHNTPYYVLVVSDISNYFDSIEHDLLIEYLAPYSLPRKAIGLLGRLIEAFKPLAGHSPNPKVGLATDTIEGSRTLAHIFLFEHDRRMVNSFGEDNYVRWMDDQSIGVGSLTDARKTVNLLTRSLADQRLTLNSGKTVFLEPTDVIVHFQLDLNQRFQDWHELFVDKAGVFKHSPMSVTASEQLIDEVKTSPHAGKGYWDKILGRAYRTVALAKLDALDNDALDHLIQYPGLDQRVFESFAARNEGKKLLDLFETYASDGENIYESTEASFFEACLLLQPDATTQKRIVDLARDVAKSTYANSTGRPLARASAVLCLYWFVDDPHELPALFGTEAKDLPKEVVRAWLASIAARIPEKFPEAITKIVGHPSDDVAQLASFIGAALRGDIKDFGNYHSLKRKPLTGGQYYDPRQWLQFEFMSRCLDELRKKAQSDYKLFEKHVSSDRDKAALARAKVVLGL